MNQENPWAGQGPVLLDIGGGVGAVVITMPAALDGVEVEARAPGHASHLRLDAHHHDHEHHHEHPHGLPAHAEHWPHVAVVGRPVGERLVHSLVFPELTPGTYALCLRESDQAALTVEVRDGEVTFAEWPASLRAA